jgi:catechol 2,3-dioxygenase-like lactoylglutathione lyase family enzyme
MTIKDSNVTIMVADMTASIAFYESIGFSLRNRWGNHYAQLTAPGITIGLHPSEENTAKNSGNIAIGVYNRRFQRHKATSRIPFNFVRIAHRRRRPVPAFLRSRRHCAVFHQAEMVGKFLWAFPLRGQAVRCKSSLRCGLFASILNAE